ncbi:hypothetical protein ACQ4PT_067913 [Festuca glaucescens]
MVVHVVLLAVPAAACGFMHAFKFAVLLWPFNLALPQLRQVPRVCITLRAAASHYAAELRAYLAGNHHNSYSDLRGVGVQGRSAERLVAHAMISLVDISY